MKLRTRIRHARTGIGPDGPVPKGIPNRNISTQSPNKSPAGSRKRFRPGFMPNSGLQPGLRASLRLWLGAGVRFL